MLPPHYFTGRWRRKKNPFFFPSFSLFPPRKILSDKIYFRKWNWLLGLELQQRNLYRFPQECLAWVTALSTKTRCKQQRTPHSVHLLPDKSGVGRRVTIISIERSTPRAQVLERIWEGILFDLGSLGARWQLNGGFLNSNMGWKMVCLSFILMFRSFYITQDF